MLPTGRPMAQVCQLGRKVGGRRSGLQLSLVAHTSARDSAFGRHCAL